MSTFPSQHWDFVLFEPVLCVLSQSLYHIYVTLLLYQEDAVSLQSFLISGSHNLSVPLLHKFLIVKAKVLNKDIPLRTDCSKISPMLSSLAPCVIYHLLQEVSLIKGKQGTYL